MKNTSEIAIEAALHAGRAIMKIYNNQQYDIQIKSDNSPVTRADRESSAIIARNLAHTKIPVIDEEIGYPDFSVRKTWEKLWLVDPMDGTMEFISGNGEFTVNIALLEHNIPVFGVIYSPVLKELYFGGPSTGSFRLKNIYEGVEIHEIESHAEHLKVNTESPLSLRMAASRSHLNESTRLYIQKIQELKPDLEFISKGSSLKLCMIAEGLVDIYPRFSRTMEWDTAAGHAILSGTGGNIINIDNGLSLQYNKENLENPSFVAFSAALDIEKWLPGNL